MNQFLFLQDYLLLPFYLLGSIFLMHVYFRVKHGKNKTLEKYFHWALYLKLFGCISISLIYQYYYYGAYDGVTYFRGALMLTKYWTEYPSEFFRVLFSDLETFNLTNKSYINAGSIEIYAEASFNVSKIAAIINFFCFNTFLPIAIIFCNIAFIGLWNFFIFIIKEFNVPLKPAAFSTIFIPSVLIWDSGIFKDTVTFTALLWLFICSYYVFIKNKNILKNTLGIIVVVPLIYFIKAYIIAAFVPFFIIFIINSNKSKIKNPAIRVFSTPFIIMFGVGSILLFFQNADELLGRYSLDQVLETASQTAYYLQDSGAGSSYTLNVDLASPVGILLAIPEAINISLFRPYPWEYLNPFILFASLESMMFLYLTVYLLFKKGFLKSMAIIYNSPIIHFCIFLQLYSLTLT